MRPEIRDMSLFRFTQIFRGLYSVKNVRTMSPFAQRLLENDEEPKPISSLWRILEKLMEFPMSFRSNQRLITSLLDVLNDKMQVNL